MTSKLIKNRCQVFENKKLCMRKTFEYLYFYNSLSGECIQIAIFPLSDLVIGEGLYNYKFFFNLNRSFNNIILKFIVYNSEIQDSLFFITSQKFSQLNIPITSTIYLLSFNTLNNFVKSTNKVFKKVPKLSCISAKIEVIEKTIRMIKQLSAKDENNQYICLHGELFKHCSIKQNIASLNKQRSQLKEQIKPFVTADIFEQITALLKSYSIFQE